MTCHDARELFSGLIDETLTREQRADVYGHLTTCADCRRELAAIERTIALVRGASPVRAPAGFVDRVLAATRPTPWYARVLSPWSVKVPLGAAAVMLIAGLAVLLFRGSQEQQQASRYEATPPVLADRRLGETPATPETPAKSPADEPTKPPAQTPAAPPPTPPAGASSDRAKVEAEQDRTASVASRVDQVETRAETKEKRDAAPETLAKREAPRAMAAARPDVIARLATPDRDAAERALAALAARLAGTITSRRVEGGTPVVELVIPRDRYADFTREAARFGVFRVESEALAPPDSVRIAVYLGSH
jgi:hypothetical protein